MLPGCAPERALRQPYRPICRGFRAGLSVALSLATAPQLERLGATDREEFQESIPSLSCSLSAEKAESRKQQQGAGTWSSVLYFRQKLFSLS